MIEADNNDKHYEQARQLLAARDLILDGFTIEVALASAPDVDEQLVRALDRLLTGGGD